MFKLNVSFTSPSIRIYLLNNYVIIVDVMLVHAVKIIIMNYVSYVILLLFKFRLNLFARYQSCVLFCNKRL